MQRAFDEVNRSEQVHWVERDEVKSFIGVLILLNTFVLGLETEFCRDKESQDCQAGLLWLVLAWFFTSAWSTEMVLRIWVLRMNYFYESLNLVDFARLANIFRESTPLRFISAVSVFQGTPLLNALSETQALRKLTLKYLRSTEQF